MNDDIFIFGVLPAAVCFVALVFSLVFGRDILNWYMTALAAQDRKHAITDKKTATYVADEVYREPAVANQKRELVHS